MLPTYSNAFINRASARPLLCAAVVLTAWSAYSQPAAIRFDGAMQRKAMRDLVGPEGVCQERSIQVIEANETITARTCRMEYPTHSIDARGNDYEMFVGVQWSKTSVFNDVRATIVRQFDAIERHGFERSAINQCTAEAIKMQQEIQGTGESRRAQPGLTLRCWANGHDLQLEVKIVRAQKPKSDF